MRSAPHSSTSSFSTDPAPTTSFLVLDFDRLLFLASLNQRASFTAHLKHARRCTRAQADSACEQLIQNGVRCVVIQAEESQAGGWLLSAAEADLVTAAFRGVAGGSLA